MSNTREPALPSIPGYTLTEQLYLGRRTAVYRAVRAEALVDLAPEDLYPEDSPEDLHPEDSHSVVIKVLSPSYPSFSDLVRFRNQYIITKNLPIHQIVKPLALIPWQHRYALVMQDVGGSVALATYLQQQGSLSVDQGLIVALQLATILHQLSQHRVVHKDIKPANILIQPDTLKTWLIDFSLASLLPKETQTTVPPKDLEGTLAYIAPEQTGRMNRGIDYRADFYGLGVTLYEAFTGHLPFDSSDDPLELIHCHLTQQPVPLHEVRSQKLEGGRQSPSPLLPTPLSDIVLKLMAKNAEDRYQSALGLKHDLQYCLSQWQETGEIAPFELGLEDRCDRFLIPEKLYGRETEVQTLLDAFERVAQGTSEIMLVAGYSGIGKTVVVNEVHKPIVKNRGYFIKGKFDQFNRNIPFSAFLQAFRSLMGQLLSESDANLAQWKTKILAVLGDSGQVLIDVIPELERIIGPQPPVPQLTGNAAQNRFNLLFEKFTAVFTTPDHPLTLFIDDLQWADSASLNLLNVLMGDNQTGYLLLLGAYRDNEVFPAHPLMLTLAELEKQQTTITTVTLSPLATPHINQLVAETLICSETLAAPLADLVYQKTQGNPFFMTQFLKGLHGDDLIVFNQNLGYWECDLVKVREAALTDDVVEFIAGRLHKLPKATQNVLKLAACVGNQFNLETLTIIREASFEDIAADLWDALREGLILPQSEAYKFFQDRERCDRPVEDITVNYRFLHDRVQQAAYSLIPEEQKSAIHLNIGQLLLTKSSQSEQEERLFDIINHLNLGLDLIVQPVEQLQLTQLNLMAAQKAKASTAYDAALTYLQLGEQLLSEDSWDKNHQLTHRFYKTLAEVEYLNGRYGEAEARVAFILDQRLTLLECAEIYPIKLQICTAQSQFSQAIDVGLAALQELQVVLEAHAPQTQLLQVETLKQLPVMVEPQKLAAMNILYTLIGPAYILRPDVLGQIINTMLHLSIEYGNAKESTYGYVMYAMILCATMEDISQGFQLGQMAVELLESLDAKICECAVLNIFGNCIRSWYKPARDDVSLGIGLKGFYSGLESGDIETAGYSIVNYCLGLVFLGLPLEELEQKFNDYLQVLKKFKQEYSTTYLGIGLSVILALQENELDEDKWSDKIQANQQLESSLITSKNRTTLFLFYVVNAMFLFMMNRTEEARNYASLAVEHAPTAPGLMTVNQHNFYYSLSLLSNYGSDYGQGLENRNHQVWDIVDTNQKTMKVWADNAPTNFLHQYHLVEAERYRILGQKSEAIELYELAIAASKDNGYIQDEGLANELAAKFYLTWGKEKVAAGYLQEAYYCYARWGAKAKINDLEQRYPTLLQPILQSPSARFNPLETLNALGKTTIPQHSVSISRQSSDIYNDELDFTAILQAAKALTTTVHLDQLLQNLGQIILQQSGADRLVLVLPKLSEFSQTQLTWIVTLVATPESIQLGNEPLASQVDIPVQLIRYVKNTQEILFADTVNTTLPVVDDYLLVTCPQSFLCSPLFHRDALTGILYLQSSTTSNLISPNRLTSLNFLFSQAAIALHNAQLYESAALKSRIIEASVHGIAILEDDRYVYLNQHHLDLFGYARSELLGQSWECLYGPEQVQWFYETACPLVKQQGQWSGETVARRKDGSTFDEEVSLFRLADGKLICICQDISERVQLEAQRQRAEAELQQSLVQLQTSNQELEAFSYSIAHDLRAPLRAINGYSHALMEDYGDRLDEMGHRYFERICSNTNRMADLIDDLLHLAQVSRLDLKCEPVDLTALAHTLLAELQAMQPDRSVDITVEADLMVMADPMLINVVMQNLLENAWKFSCDRTPTQIELGILHLDLPSTLDTPIDSKHSQDTSSPIYFVRDNGVGFDMTYADKLFGIFQRLHGMEEFPGTGIGLVIAKRAIQRHGGRIWATAKVDQGATFYFTLPEPQPGRP